MTLKVNAIVVEMYKTCDVDYKRLKTLKIAYSITKAVTMSQSSIPTFLILYREHKRITTIMMLIESSVHHIASNDGPLFSSPPAGGGSGFISKHQSLYSLSQKVTADHGLG